MRILRDDPWVSRSLRELGEYSEAELRFMQRLLTPDSVVVEAGAYIGDLTIPLSRCCKEVIAFEPQAEVRELLVHNLAQNGCTNVQVQPYAVGHTMGEAMYCQPDPASPGSTMMTDGVAGATGATAVVTIDSLALPRVDLIKGDVEGMEVLLLAGAQDTIRRCQPLLLMEVDTVLTPNQLSVEEVYRRHLGYDYHRLTFMMWDPANWRSAPNPFGATASFMALGLPYRAAGAARSAI